MFQIYNNKIGKNIGECKKIDEHITNNKNIKFNGEHCFTINIIKVEK